MTPTALKSLYALFTAAAVAGCGGASQESPTSGSATSVIRFAAHYQPGCSSCLPATDSVLSIGPVDGARALGNRAIAQVELRVDGKSVQTLAEPNSVGGDGAPRYRIAFPPPTQATPFLPSIRDCRVLQNLEIAVTDVSGFRYTKSIGPCREETFGGFSDYGDTTVAFEVTSSADGLAGFTRYGTAGMTDTALVAAASNASWSLRARDGDELYARGPDYRTKAIGTVTTVAIEAPGGGFAYSTAITRIDDGGFDSTYLLCCTGASASQRTIARQVKVQISPNRFGVPMGPDTPRPVGSIKYRVADPATGATAAEYTSAASEGVSVLLSVYPGQVVTAEGSPLDEGVSVGVTISQESTPAAGANQYYQLLGNSISNRVNTPARLKVVCCVF